tara:strand:- start:1041 stop:1178 length:138 start_codon:yes stop_codon:yes gene_type:complete
MSAVKRVMKHALSIDAIFDAAIANPELQVGVSTESVQSEWLLADE